MSEKIPMRVSKGALTPADRHAIEAMRSRNYSVGDLVYAELTKPRNPKFHRLVHAFGEMLADNVDAFTGMQPHNVLKRLQLEGDIACDHIAINFPGVGPCTYRIPQSLSYASMKEEKFSEVYKAMCDYVSNKYWPDLTAEQVADMAEIMPEAAA